MTKGDTLQVRLKDGSGSFPVTVDNLAVCRDCQAPVAWCTTPKGKKMPVDADPADDGIYDVHWSRCSGKVEGGSAPAPKPAPSAPKPTVDQTVINGILNRLDAIEVKLGMAADLPFALLIAAMLVM